MYAIIVEAVLHKLATFKDTSKHARNGKQSSLAQMRKSKRHQQPMRGPFTMQYNPHR